MKAGSRKQKEPLLAQQELQEVTTPEIKAIKPWKSEGHFPFGVV